jgi:hypothetical protein
MSHLREASRRVLNASQEDISFLTMATRDIGDTTKILMSRKVHMTDPQHQPMHERMQMLHEKLRSTKEERASVAPGSGHKRKTSVASVHSEEFLKMLDEVRGTQSRWQQAKQVRTVRQPRRVHRSRARNPSSGGPFCARCLTPRCLVTRSQAIYSTMENPSHSIISRVYEALSMSLVLTTTISFVLEKEEFASSVSAESFFS